MVFAPFDRGVVAAGKKNLPGVDEDPSDCVPLSHMTFTWPLSAVNKNRTETTRSQDGRANT
jgi:hypothetical protein